LRRRVRPGRIELAEKPAEREELRVGKLLAAKADHQMIEPGPADLGEGRRRQRARQVRPAHLGAQRVGKLLDTNRSHG